MKKSGIAVFFGLFVSCVFVFGMQEKLSPDELPERYRRWLEEEVVYIITAVERDVFLQLENDRARELFIEAFWKHRDQIPETPENEFKEEHYQRLKDARMRFGRGTPTPGWATARGRMYIILGPPQTIERYENENEIYPTIVWFYQGMSKYGLPNAFNLIFFKKYGAGDYELYSPIEDGPQNMLKNYFGDPKNYLAAYEELRRVQPELAMTSMTLLPQEPIYGPNPSLASEMLLANIEVKPKESIKDEYAKKLLEYKDIIEVEYSTNYIDNDALAALIYDERQCPYIHYLVEPERLSIAQTSSGYYTSLEVSGQVTDKNSKTIYQFNRTIPIQFGEEELEKIGSQPFSFQDIFPLCPGEYHFHLLIKNRTSKEFTSFERDLIVPEEGPSPTMSSLILAPYIQENSLSSEEKAFRVGKTQLYPSASYQFAMNETLHVLFQLPHAEKWKIDKGNITFVISKGEEEILREVKSLSAYPSPNTILEAFPLTELKPAHYTLDVSVQSASGEVLFSDFQHFGVSPVETLPRPFIYSQTAPASNSPEANFILGSQYFNKNNLEKAHQHLEDAFHHRPNSLTFALGYARILYAEEDYAAAQRILKPFADQEEGDTRFLKFLGDISQKMGQYMEAVSYYRRYIEGQGISTGVLNSLGQCFYQLRNPEEALAAWEKSLELNPDQPEVKKMVDSLK